MEKSGLVIPDYIGIDGQKRTIRHASEFWDHYGVSVHEENTEPGDLVFFSRNGLYPSHVGIVCDKEQFIHSPGKDGEEVRTSSIEEYKQPKQPAERPERILYSKNPIGFKSPVVSYPEMSYRYHQSVI